MPDTNLRLYAPDAGRDDLRNQVELRDNVQFCYPDHLRFRLQRDLWRVKGVVKDLKADGVEVAGPLFDTMLAHYLVKPEQRHNMYLLAEKYLQTGAGEDVEK